MCLRGGEEGKQESTLKPKVAVTAAGDPKTIEMVLCRIWTDGFVGYGRHPTDCGGVSSITWQLSMAFWSLQSQPSQQLRHELHCVSLLNVVPPAASIDTWPFAEPSFWSTQLSRQYEASCRVLTKRWDLHWIHKERWLTSNCSYHNR